MLPNLTDTRLSPLEITLNRIMTEFVVGKATKEEILSEAHKSLTSEIDLATCIRILNNEQLEGYIDEGPLVSQPIMMMKQARYFPPFMHAHAFFEVIYVYQGKCTNVFRDSLFEMTEGDIFFIPPGMEHSLSVYDDNSIVINVLLRKKTFLNAFSGIINKNDVFSEFFSNAIFGADRTTAIYARCGKQVRDLFFSAYNEFDTGDIELSSRILTLQFQLLISYIVRDHRDSLVLYESSKQKNPILPLLRYLEKEYAVATRDSTAHRFGYNSDYLNRLIKTHTGKTFLGLLTQIRMQKASDLLSTTNLSVETISELCGYLSKSSFYVAFKKAFDTTPHLYRIEKQSA